MRWYEITESEPQYLTADQIIKQYPGLVQTKDLDSVAEWLNVTSKEDLLLRIDTLPIESLKESILEMKSTYDEFPKDAKRTSKIIKLLKTGSAPLPVFIEEGDIHLFVMEGRHRMVAFYDTGMSEIPVVYCKANIEK